MTIGYISFELYNNNSYKKRLAKPNQEPYIYNTQNVINFTGEDFFEKAKNLGNKVVDKAKGTFSNFSSLFDGKNIELTESEKSFIEGYLIFVENIKAKYDEKIRKMKDGWLDVLTNKSEKKRQELRDEKEKELKDAYLLQDFFEKKELEAIEIHKKFNELAKQLNFSKEIIMAFEKAQTESEKRLAIIKRRKEIMEQKGLSQIGGYTQEKIELQRSFIDKIDDERAGKYLTEKIPNAILFYGPTGCGKSTFAKALAEETDCNYKIIQCRGSQKDKERNLFNILDGHTELDDFGNEIEAAGLLEKAQANFEKTGKRTIILIDEFDRFFGKDVSNHFINYMKGVLENASKDYHVTFFLTSNKPQRIPYELRSAHRIAPVYFLDPPDRANTAAVIEHYLQGCKTQDMDYDTILEELFKYAPNEVYSNAHLKTICEIAADEIKQEEEPLTTDMFLQAIKKYNESSDDHNILRITENYLKQYNDDKANI